MTQILIVTHNPELQRLSGALAADAITAKTADSYERASQILVGNSRCVCVIDGDLPRDFVRKVCELAFRSHNRRVVILAGPELAARSNADYPKGVDVCPRGDTFEESVVRLKGVLILSGHDVRITASQSGSGEMPSSDEISERKGEVYAVFSAKGGVGKTTIAVNLAVGLAQVYGRNPLLVDGNLYFGDVPVLLNVTLKKSIADLCSLTDFDTLTLKTLVTEHEFGVSVLGSPPDVTTVDALNIDMLVKAIGAYRDLFDYVIVDTRSSLDEATLQILDAADRIILVVTPEVSALYQTSRFLTVADALGYSDKLMPILNRAGSGLAVKAVEEHLGIGMVASVVSAGLPVIAAANRGIPLLMDDPDRKEKSTRDLLHLVELVAPKPEPTVQTKPRSMLALPARLLLRSAT